MGIWGGNPRGRARKEGYGVWRTRENSKISFETKKSVFVIQGVAAVVRSLSRVCPFAVPGTAARKAPLSYLSPRVYSDSRPQSQ